MKVIDLINQSESTAFSFEILPPLKGNSIQKVYNVIDKLKEFNYYDPVKHSKLFPTVTYQVYTYLNNKNLWK